MIWHWEISHKLYVFVFTSCSVKLPVVDDVITFLLILSKANVARADAFCKNKLEISTITICSCKRTIHCPTKEYHLVEEDYLLVAFNNYWWCLPTDVSLSKSYLNYRDVYLLRVFIRHWRYENSPLTMQNSLANVWWPMTSFFSDVEPLLKINILL